MRNRASYGSRSVKLFSDTIRAIESLAKVLARHDTPQNARLRKCLIARFNN